MAKVKIQGHASGTGILTVTAPNTSTDRTITLPDATGTLATTDINSFTNDTTITNGDIVFATADKGIVLGATTNVDANTLDDYEEGTFTMTASGSTGSAGTYAGSTTGRYVKIGSFVWFSIDFNITNRGSWTGYMYFNGLPFTANSAQGHHPIGVNSYKTTKRNHGAYVKLNSTTVLAREEDQYGEEGISWDDLEGSVTDVFGFHGFYKV